MRYYRICVPAVDKLKRMIIWAGIVSLTYCLSANAEPSYCPIPTETDNWQMTINAPPTLTEMDGCVSEKRQFRINGFHPPYTLWETTGISEWEQKHEVKSRFLYASCDQQELPCTQIKISDALGHDSNPFVLIQPAPLKYDPGNPTDVNPNNQSSVVISIIDGVSPFSWSVSGNGFSFAASETTERYNILDVTPDACGAGNISVQDDCGEKTSGSIRSTNGTWVVVSECRADQSDSPGYVILIDSCYSLQPTNHLVSPVEGWTFEKHKVRTSKNPFLDVECPDVPCSLDDTSSSDEIITYTVHLSVHRWECP